MLKIHAGKIIDSLSSAPRLLLNSHQIQIRKSGIAKEWRDIAFPRIPFSRIIYTLNACMYVPSSIYLYVCMYKVAPESVLFLSISVREISKSPLQRILLGPSPLPHKSPGPSISLKVFSSRPSLKSPKVCRSRMEGLN
jgi:hypothetical protein